MKKTILFLASIILISNALWLYLFLDKGAEDIVNSDVSLYSLHGSGEAWEVHDYKILITPDKILRGHASLNYMGDPADLSQSTFFEYKFYENNNRGEKEVVYANEFHSYNGVVSILDNVKDTGSLTGPYSDGELEKDKSNYGSTSLEITWNDKEGQRRTEVIQLNIDKETMIKADE